LTDSYRGSTPIFVILLCLTLTDNQSGPKRF